MPLVRFLIIPGAIAAMAVAPIGAQVSQPVVQSTGEGGLNAALSRLARNPRDIEALMDAGAASLAAGDGDAAIGFFQKADALSPASSRIKAGLAGAYVLTGDPVSAIPLFEAAEKFGAIDAARTADRGLAFDMIGDPTTAQRYYHEALIAGPSDETSRRLALSEAISGDRRAMEVTLAPLLQRQDKAAWRTRAFALAILGQGDEAESIAKATMPADLASAMTNYLRFMTKLTHAQQAAAANLGQFPRAAEIGRDDPRFALLVRTRPIVASTTPVKLAQRDDRKSKPQETGRITAVQAPGSTIAATATRSAPAGELPPLTRPGKSAAPPVAPPVSRIIDPPPANPTPVAIIQPAPAAPAPIASERPPVAVAVQPSTAPSKAPASGPGFDSLDNPAPKFDLKPSAAQAAAPARPVAAKPVAAAKPRSLAEVFADLSQPSREVEPKAGAVDLRKLSQVSPATKLAAADTKTGKLADKACEVPEPKTARSAKAAKPIKGAKAKLAAKNLPTACKDTKDEKAKGPTNPSRIWVQVATGRDKKALAFDWRRLVKDDAALFKSRKAFTANWGQTNRLLTGPFETAAQANAFIARLKKAGVDGAFSWNSPAGQVVDALPGT